MSRKPSQSSASLILASCLGASLALVSAAPAGTVQFQLGEQDFADGKSPVYSREIREAGRGEMFPFDGTVFGHDVKRADGLGAFDYTHTFDLAGGSPVSATLTVGLIDIDSPPDHPLETLSLTLNGVGQSTDWFTGMSAVGAKSSVEVVDIPVPVEMLRSGSLHVAFAALMPGYGNLGNAIEPDFSRLTIQVGSPDIVIPGPDPIPVPIPDPGPGPQPIPLPPALIPAAVLIAGLAATPKRRLRRWLRV